MKREAARGFTLIELMIVVAVIGILAAIAYPSYVDSVRKSRRADALAALTDARLKQEKYRASNISYGTRVQAGISASSPDGYYDIDVPPDTLGNNTFIVEATGADGKGQDNDTGCTTINIDQDGEITPAECASR